MTTRKIERKIEQCALCGDNMRLVVPRNWYRPTYWQHMAKPAVPHKPQRLDKNVFTS